MTLISQSNKGVIMSRNVRDRRLTRHGRNILTDEQLDQLTDGVGQKSIFDTAIVTEFVSK